MAKSGKVPSLNLTDFDFPLPPESIAQEPLPDRSASRMLVVRRESGTWEDRCFRDLPQFLRPGDCLVLNDSRVIPSRLYATRPGRTGKIEVFLVQPVGADTWEALVKPGRKVPVGERLLFGEGLEAEVLNRAEHGERRLKFFCDGDFYEVLDRLGHVPLPPYIKRPDTAADRERYQTVYANERGSVAAPTAGLHFTPEVLDACRAAGAAITRVTLHVGLGTFQPLHAENVEEATLHTERYSVTAEAAKAIDSAQRVVAVGTTSVRTIESVATTGNLSGDTNLFLYPGCTFRKTGAMLTNFHLPQSSLFVLVCAFAGTGLMQAAYRHAITGQFRFFSYGDCMLIL